MFELLPCQNGAVRDKTTLENPFGETPLGVSPSPIPLGFCYSLMNKKMGKLVMGKADRRNQPVRQIGVCRLSPCPPLTIKSAVELFAVFYASAGYRCLALIDATAPSTDIGQTITR